MNDEKIIELYWQRNQSALSQTDLKYGGLCRGIALNILGCREDAEESVSDAYLSLWNSLPPQRPACFKAYTATTARNISLNRLRERRSKKHGGGEIRLALEELDGCLASDSCVEREYDLKELAGAIESFLYSLPDDDRKIFMCRYWLLSPVSDIAAKLGFSGSKVKTSLFRSRQKLREYLTREALI